MKEQFRKKLADASTFGEIFNLVKKAVKNTLGLHRAGLELVLMNLPNNIGGLHEVGSNTIIMNKTLLEGVIELAKSKIEVNSYVFVVLLHEYLHSLGYIDDEEVSSLVKKIVAESLGEDHPAYEIASTSIFTIYPELQMLGPGKIGRDMKIIKDFDKDNVNYIL
ncbi:MAG: hypothetical protein QXK95_01170 [Nitrososphaerota archaeon]|nr:hypothetical protein [Candidatus Geocrenenecus dongiae]